MNNIMVDNWFMEDIIGDIKSNKIQKSKSYSNLLMSIVLWDNIFYPKNEYNWWNSFPSQVQNILYPIDDTKEAGMEIAEKLFIDFERTRNKELSWDEWKNTSSSQNSIIGKGALRYMVLSNSVGCDYLPCAERQFFLSKYNNREIIGTELTRLKMQNQLDKSIEKYYTDTFNALLDFSILKIDMPVLTQYIFDNTPKGMTPIDYAFHLKHEGPVIKYRQYLSEIENALENQNWAKLRKLLKFSNDIVSDVIKIDKKYVGRVNVKIFPFPTVSYGDSIFNSDVCLNPLSGISVSKEISIHRKIHLTFLTDLTKYAINDLKLW